MLDVLRRAGFHLTRAIRRAEVNWLVLLVLMTLGCAAMSFVFRAEWPLGVYLIPLLLAMNVMSLGRLLLLDLVTAVCLAGSLALLPLTPLRLLGVAALLLSALIVTLHTRSRTKLGLLPRRGDAMLIDLRDRLASQSQLPVLPRGWHA
jgi:hypothetical protein